MYFAGLLSDRYEGGAVRGDSYAALLASLGEPSLSYGQKVDEAYRLLIRRWEPLQVSIRVWRTGGEMFVASVREHRYSPDSGRIAREQRLTQRQWDAVAAAARDVDLLHRRVRQLPPPGGFEVIPEPQSWVFEARERGRYNVAVRGILRGESPAFLILARALHAAADLPLPDVIAQ